MARRQPDLMTRSHKVSWSFNIVTFRVRRSDFESGLIGGFLNWDRSDKRQKKLEAETPGRDNCRLWADHIEEMKITF
jgi:hypothetical protein